MDFAGERQGMEVWRSRWRAFGNCPDLEKTGLQGKKCCKLPKLLVSRCRAFCWASMSKAASRFASSGAGEDEVVVVWSWKKYFLRDIQKKILTFPYILSFSHQNTHLPPYSFYVLLEFCAKIRTKSVRLVPLTVMSFSFVSSFPSSFPFSFELVVDLADTAKLAVLAPFSAPLVPFASCAMIEAVEGANNVEDESSSRTDINYRVKISQRGKIKGRDM